MDSINLNKQSEDIFIDTEEVIKMLNSNTTGNSPSYNSTRPIPWRRFFARYIDFIIGLTLLYKIYPIFVRPKVLDTDFGVSLGDQLMVTVLITIWLVIEAAIISKHGTTFGKWLFNIKVYDSSTFRFLSFSRALKRNFLRVMV